MNASPVGDDCSHFFLIDNYMKNVIKMLIDYYIKCNSITM